MSTRPRSFFSFRECPRSLEVSAIWKKSRHWTPSKDPWRILFTSIMSPLFNLQGNDSSFSNWTHSSYSESLRYLTNLVELRWTFSRSLISFFSHGRPAWNEYSMWGWMNAPYNLWKSAGVISMNDVFITLIIEFAFFAAFAHWRLGLSVSSTMTPKYRWRLTHLRSSPFS